MVTYWIPLNSWDETEEAFLAYINYIEEDSNDEDSIVQYGLESEKILNNIIEIINHIMNTKLSLDSLIDPDGNNNIQELKKIGLGTMSLAEGVQIEFLGGKVVFKNDKLDIECDV